MSGDNCTCGKNFRLCEDYRDHLPCPGSALEQATARAEKAEALAACRYRALRVGVRAYIRSARHLAGLVQVRAETAEAEVVRLRGATRPSDKGCPTWCPVCAEPLKHEMAVAFECYGHTKEADLRAARAVRYANRLRTPLENFLRVVETCAAEGVRRFEVSVDSPLVASVRAALKPDPAADPDASLRAQLAALPPMTDEEREAQRRDWAYGNVRLSNPDVTREMVDKAADAMPAPPARKDDK